MDVVYDFAVLGAGIEGSATAYSLVSSSPKATKVLLLEQFDALHSRGSSHGPSRITRRTYEHLYYVKMMDLAYQLWGAVERKSGVKLFQRTGLLTFGKNSVFLQNTITSLEQNKTPHEVLSGSEANKRFPQQLNLPADYMCVYDDEAGIIMSSRALAAYHKLFVAEGGVFLDNHQVVDIQPGLVVTLQTNQGVFKTRRLIIAAGSWSKGILSSLGLQLPLKVVRTEVYYWKAKHFSYKQFPCVINYESDRHLYGLPAFEYPGLFKFCPYDGVEVSDPDERDFGGVAAAKDSTSAVVESVFKGVDSEPSIYHPCLFTLTPDLNPILDVHPSYHNIVIGTGFSGHGFKLAPVVGKLLCELSKGIPTSFDMAPFKISRFHQSKM